MEDSCRLRVLWLSSTPGLFDATANVSGYYGGGWISSLQKAVQEIPSISLALAFPQQEKRTKIVKDATTYYCLHKKSLHGVAKLLYYYRGYRCEDTSALLSEILWAIDDFRPDVIQLFGIESELACILGQTTIPVVIHLQGLLAPYNNAFFPGGVNKASFLWPPSVREWVLRNGYIFAKEKIKVRGKKESSLFKKVNYLMGRTEWDRQISLLLAPQASYFHVDEILRDVFYENAGKWQRPQGKVIIASTISNTVYKGLDVILKTANLLKKETQLSFVWKVFGINTSDGIVKFFERETGIMGSEVNVVYCGPKSPVDLCHELLGAHVYVHPSYIDNSPNSVCEAQMLGLPVIATNVGGVSTIVEHLKTGILVPANAPYELAYYLTEIINNETLSQSLGVSSSHVAAQRHSKEDILDAIHMVYKNMVLER